jgi:soluble P-type ATPase
MVSSSKYKCGLMINKTRENTMPGWLTTLLALVQEIPEIVALVEKIIGTVVSSADKKAAVVSLTKAVASLPKEL